MSHNENDHVDDVLRVQWTPDGHVGEGSLHTWLDDAFDAHEAARIMAHVVECAVCTAAVAEARGLMAGSSRIVRALDDLPAQVIPTGTPPSRVMPRDGAAPRLRTVVWWKRSVWQAAAMVLIAGGATAVWVRGTNGRVLATATADRVISDQAQVAGEAETINEETQRARVSERRVDAVTPRVAERAPAGTAATTTAATTAATTTADAAEKAASKASVSPAPTPTPRATVAGAVPAAAASVASAEPATEALKRSMSDALAGRGAGGSASTGADANAAPIMTARMGARSAYTAEARASDCMALLPDAGATNQQLPTQLRGTPIGTRAPGMLVVHDWPTRGAETSLILKQKGPDVLQGSADSPDEELTLRLQFPSRSAITGLPQVTITTRSANRTVTVTVQSAVCKYPMP